MNNFQVNEFSNLNSAVLLNFTSIPESMPEEKLNKFMYILDSNDLIQFKRYKIQRKKIEFLVGRYVLKGLLGKFLGVNPSQVSLIKNKYGKLFINKLYEKEVYFNLSHTDNMILCGITKIGKIGVDIEKNDKNFLEIMNLVFTPEEIRYVNSFNNRLCKINAFYKIWTRKEAYMKMIGKGFSLDPLSFSVPAILDEDEDRRVLFYTHNFSNEYVFSIAVKNNKGYGNIKYIVNSLNLGNLY